MWRWTSFLPIAVIVTVMVLTTGCTHTPEAVVSRFLDYTFLDNNGEKAYELLSSDDRNYISKEEFTGELRRKNVLNKKILEKYEDYFYYNVLISRQEGDTTYVTVEISKPNAVHVLSDIVGYAMITAFGSLPELERNQAITQKFDAIMMSKDRLLVTEEKVYKVVKEKNGYKLYLNFGMPEKTKVRKEKAALLGNMADEYARTINYDKAVELYKQAASLFPEKQTSQKIKDIENLQNNILSLGQVKVLGNLKFCPQKIEKRTMAIAKDEANSNPLLDAQQEFLVLTFQAKNVSEGQVFTVEKENQFQFESLVTDNYGNQLKELKPKFVAGKTEEKGYCKLLPGQCRTYTAFVEAPLTDIASKFIWRVKLNTDNSGKQEYAFVGFTKEDFKEQKLLVSK